MRTNREREVFSPSVVIYNPNSGNGKSEKMASAFNKYWPEVKYVAPVQELIEHPKTFQEYCVIACGGDGTVSLAVKQICQEESSWCLPVSSGTMNVVSGSLETNSHLGETLPQYVGRLATWMNDGNLIVKKFLPREVKSNLDEESFLWTGGVGALLMVLEEMERQRSKNIPLNLRKTLAVLKVATVFNETHSYEMQVGNEPKTRMVMDAHIIKSGFKSYGGLRFPTGLVEHDKLLYIDKPDPGEYWTQLVRVAIDAMLMHNHLRPAANGIKLANVDGITVQIEGNIQKHQVDSEMRRDSVNRIIFQAPDVNAVPYRMIAKKVS